MTPKQPITAKRLTAGHYVLHLDGWKIGDVLISEYIKGWQFSPSVDGCITIQGANKRQIMALLNRPDQVEYMRNAIGDAINGFEADPFSHRHPLVRSK